MTVCGSGEFAQCLAARKGGERRGENGVCEEEQEEEETKGRDANVYGP